MKSLLYNRLQKKLILLTLLVSILPLAALGTMIYLQFSQMVERKINEQIRYRASAQAESVDLFLKERTAILSAMADTNTFSEMLDENHLAALFEVMNARAGAFVDLGVIDQSGVHRAYIGPYDLKGLNYSEQDWFANVMRKGIYISDVYMGYRKSPHFIIAVRRQEGLRTWILRATIDPGIFGNIVSAAQIGKTGDAFLLNAQGYLQTNSRFDGQILRESHLDPSMFGGGITVFEAANGDHRKIFYAGCWLKRKQWLLVISQDAAEEMQAFFATRNAEIAIIGFGIVAITLMTIFTTRLTVNRLQDADIRLNELNAQLVQSDKMAAMGKMAAGVAHEINNPLAVILQKTGWMEDLLLEEEFQNSKNYAEFQDAVQKIETHVERARKVVHNMLGYARKMEPHLEDVDINETLNQTISLLENYARINNIHIQTDLADDLPIIAGDQSLFQQVFLNLISNAIDAIGKNGDIDVASRREQGHIQVVIRDNGPGIPEEKRKRVFDHFFTTKTTGKGTGLGLWICYNIMEKINGRIRLESEEGQGAAFTLEIPIVLPEKK
jgi:two-component system NtrC family sensor kinase